MKETISNKIASLKSASKGKITLRVDSFPQFKRRLQGQLLFSQLALKASLEFKTPTQQQTPLLSVWVQALMSLDLALVVEYQIPKSKIEHQTLKAKQSQKYWMLALNFRIILVGIKVASTVLYIYIWSLQISFKFCTVTDFNLYKQPSQIFNNFGQILIKSSNLVSNLTKLVTTFAWFRRNANGII